MNTKERCAQAARSALRQRKEAIHGPLTDIEFEYLEIMEDLDPESRIKALEMLKRLAQDTPAAEAVQLIG